LHTATMVGNLRGLYTLDDHWMSDRQIYDAQTLSSAALINSYLQKLCRQGCTQRNPTRTHKYHPNQHHDHSDALPVEMK
jgi:hypothetical protein